MAPTFLPPPFSLSSRSSYPRISVSYMVPIASANPASSRRSFLAIALASSLAINLPKRYANAISLSELILKRQVAEVKMGREKVTALKATLEEIKNFTADESVYVQRYVPIYIEPLRENMEKSCKQLGPVEKTCAIAQAMRGHIFELNVAARNENKTEVFKELDEILETADKFIGLAKNAGLT